MYQGQTSSNLQFSYTNFLKFSLIPTQYLKNKIKHFQLVYIFK